MLYGSINVSAEDLKPDPKGPLKKLPSHAIAAFQGKWKISYDNGFQRVYTINQLGSVTSIDVNGKKASGKLQQKGEVYLLTLEKNKIERIALMEDGALKIEHFFPAAKLEAGLPCIPGVGVKMPEN